MSELSQRPLKERLIIAAAALLIVVFGACAFVPYGNANEASNPSPQAQATKPAESAKTSAQAAAKKPEYKDMRAHYIDVGQGDAELLELPDGKIMIIDAGKEEAGDKVVKYLKDKNIDHIDYLVASNFKEEHIGGMPKVLEAVSVKEAYIPNDVPTDELSKKFTDALSAKQVSVHRILEKNDLVDEDEYQLTLLPIQNTQVGQNPVTDALLVQTTYKSVTFLFTGDAVASQITRATSKRPTVLKAARHGSGTGTDKALLASASTVIMSYAKDNPEGTPEKDLLTSIEDAKAKSYGTAANGTILVKSNGETATVSCEKYETIVAGVSAEEKAKQEEEAKKKAEAEEKARQEQQAQEEAKRQQQQQQLQQQQQQQQKQEKTVYITQTGKSYHRDGCKTTKRSKVLIPISESDAIAQGYAACNVCRP